MGGAIHVCHQGEVELERWVGGAITIGAQSARAIAIFK